MDIFTASRINQQLPNPNKYQGQLYKEYRDGVQYVFEKMLIEGQLHWVLQTNYK